MTLCRKFYAIGWNGQNAALLIKNKKLNILVTCGIISTPYCYSFPKNGTILITRTWSLKNSYYFDLKHVSADLNVAIILILFFGFFLELLQPTDLNPKTYATSTQDTKTTVQCFAPANSIT
jgi:hypothetical protein